MVRKDTHPAYLDLLVQKHLTGDITADEAGDLADHLAGCPGCAREEKLLLKKVALLGAARLPELSEDFKPRLFGKLGLERRVSAATPLAEPTAQRAGRSLLAAAAACIALGVASVLGIRFYDALYPTNEPVVLADGLQADDESYYSLFSDLRIDPPRFAAEDPPDSNSPRMRVYSDRASQPPRFEYRELPSKLREEIPARGKGRPRTRVSIPPRPKRVTIVVETRERDRVRIESELRKSLNRPSKSAPRERPSYEIIFRTLPEREDEYLWMILCAEILARLLIIIANGGRYFRWWIAALLGSPGLPYYLWRMLRRKNGNKTKKIQRD